MTPESLAALAVILLSLLFSYLPGWATLPLSANLKRVIMLVLLAFAAGCAYALACAGVDQVPIPCDQAGLFSLLKVFFDALIANQATYLLSPCKVTYQVLA